MVDDLFSSVALAKLDRKHTNRQAKKDAKFEVPDFVIREKSAEDLRQERDRKYLEDNFPDLESDYEKSVRFGK